MVLKLRTVNVTPAPGARPEPWLDDYQQRAWRQIVGLFMTLPGAIDSDLQRNAGLSLYEYLVLAALSETPDRTLQMSDLAYRANSSLSRLSHLISRLEKRGGSPSGLVRTTGEQAPSCSPPRATRKSVAQLPVTQT
jgi:hypothetical protein